MKNKPFKHGQATGKVITNIDLAIGQSQDGVDARLPMSRRVPLILGGLIVYGFATYIIYNSIQLYRLPNLPEGLPVPEDVSDRYERTAEHFDQDIDLTEKLIGMGWLRQRLTRKASGHVLEVSVGTGRNASFYNLKDCKSIAMIDQSKEMVKIAREKFNATHPKYRKCSFVIQSAHDQIACPTPQGFDTVLQTMGLCSTPQPARLLAHLGSITNPIDGRIFLLEHGQSHYAWLNRILDKTAQGHADKHGCWWNRNIGKIVEDSGLEIIEIKRYHFGTTWWIELKPKKG